MKVLHINKLLLKIMGLLKTNDESDCRRFLTIFWLFFALILVPPSITYVYENITDTTKTTEIIYVIATNISSAIKTGYFLFYRESINAILSKLQEIVDKSNFIYITFKTFLICYRETLKANNCSFLCSYPS